MNIRDIQPDGPTVVVEGQPYGEQPAQIHAEFGIKKPETNGDRWRKMTDREIAEYIFRHGSCEYCPFKEDGFCMWDANNSDECIEGLTKWAGSEANADV